MKLKILSIAALSLALMGGAALAQATSSTSADGATDPAVLGNAEKMGVFYSDETQATLKGDDELRTAWSSMSADDQTALRSDCKALDRGNTGVDPLSPSVLVLCGKINEYQ